MLVVRDVRRRQSKNFGDLGLDPNFFFEFSHRCLIVRLARVHMTGRGRIQLIGMVVFVRGTELNVDFSSRVEEEDMRGSVHESPSMHFTASLGSDHVIIGIHDFEDL